MVEHFKDMSMEDRVKVARDSVLGKIGELKNKEKDIATSLMGALEYNNPFSRGEDMHITELGNVQSDIAALRLIGEFLESLNAPRPGVDLPSGDSLDLRSKEEIEEIVKPLPVVFPYDMDDSGRIG